MVVSSRIGKKIFGACLLVSSAVLHSSAQTGTPDVIITPEISYQEPFAGFSNHCSQKIIYRSIMNISLATHNADGDELIVLDHSLRFVAQRYEHNFLAAHECAHHLLGDTRPEGIFARKTIKGAVSQQELRADCWAAEFMGALGRDRDIKRMAEGLYRRGRNPAGGGYPSGYDRAITVQRCWKRGRNKRLSEPDIRLELD